MELIKTSEDIQGGMERCDLYWKKLGSADEGKEVIYRLGQIQLEDRILWLYCYSIISYVTVTNYYTFVTQSHDIWKNVKDSRKIMLYSILTVY